MASLQYSIPVSHGAWYLLPLTRTSGVAASTVIENAVLCFVVAGLTAKSSLLAFFKAYRILVSLKVSEDCVVIVVLVGVSHSDTSS